MKRKPRPINEPCFLQTALCRVAVGVFCLSALSVACREEPGCRKDTDCKGDRICEKSICVSPGGEAAGKKSSPAEANENIRGTEKSSTPGGPGAQPKKGIFGTDVNVRLCRNGDCRDLDHTLMSDPARLLNLFGKFGGGMDFSGTRLEICSGGNCVELDEDFGQDPDEIFRLFGMLGNVLSGAGSNMLFGAGSGPRSSGKLGAKRDPSGKITYRSSGELIGDGDAAVGRVAELEGLEISAVRESQVVFRGQGNLLVVVDVPPALGSMVSKLRMHASKVTVTFYVIRTPLSNLVHGELISFK